jgi:hypothetical protein
MEAGARHLHSKQVIVRKVVHVQKYWILFSCEFDGKFYAYDFEAPNEAVLLKVKSILEGNVGKSLLSIGEIEIPER